MGQDGPLVRASLLRLYCCCSVATALSGDVKLPELKSRRAGNCADSFARARQRLRMWPNSQSSRLLA